MKTGLLLLQLWHTSHSVKTLQLKQAWHKIAYNHLSRYVSKQSLSLEYREKLLIAKQTNLFEMEQRLNDERRQQQQYVLNERLLKPLGMSIDLNLVSQTIEDIKQLIALSQFTHDDTFLTSLKEKETKCFELEERIREKVKAEFDKLCEERHLVENKLHKLTELQCYEEYLMNLQQLIQQKEKSLNIPLKRKRRGIFNQQGFQSQIGAVSMISGDQGDIPYDNIDHKEVNHINRHSYKLNQYAQDASFNCISQNNYFANCSSEQQHHSHQTQINPSKTQIQSKIKKHSQHQIHSVRQQIKKTKKIFTQEQSSQYQPQSFLHQNSITNETSLKSQCCVSIKRRPFHELRKHELIFKYLQKWFAVCLGLSKKSNISEEQVQTMDQKSLNDHKKQMQFFRWRLKTGKTLTRVNDKKERALQACLSFDRKKWSEIIRMIRLKNLFRYKAHKERLIVVLMFNKFRFHCRSEVGFSQTRGLRQNVSFEERKKHNKSVTMKENVCLKKKNAAAGNVKKLESYIQQKQIIQKRLILQCARTQSVLKIDKIMRGKNIILTGYAFAQIQKKFAEGRMNILQEQILTMEFKWQLFVTKIRLALTCTSNKISQLQNILSFAIDK